MLILALYSFEYANQPDDRVTLSMSSRSPSMMITDDDPSDDQFDIYH